MILKRCEKNPIVTPGIYEWRKATVFNPAVIYDNSKFYMLERAAGTLRPHKCYIGLLESDDGITFNHVVDKPVFTPEQVGWPHGSVQDPRVVKFDDTYYMVYAVRPFSIHRGQPADFRLEDYYEQYNGPQDNITRSAIAVSKDLINWEHKCFVTPEGVDDRDVILFPEKINGKYAMLRRPMGELCEAYGPSIWITYSDNLEDWSAPQLVAKPNKKRAWESLKIGGSTPPIKTDKGWLTLYHGVSADMTYAAGAMLLDLEDPAKVLARTAFPILEPLTDYERTGLFIPNVVFPCGNVVKDGIIYIYYGCADLCIAMASAKLDDLVDWVERAGLNLPSEDSV